MRVLLATSLSVVASVAGLSLLDGGFAPRTVRCNLDAPAEAFETPLEVGPSPIGHLAWHGLRLATLPVGIGAGDRIRLVARLQGAAERVVVRVDDREVAVLEVGDCWRQHEITTPIAGDRLILERTGGATRPVHLSRLTWTNFHGVGTPPLTGWLVHQTRSRAKPGAAPALVFGVLTAGLLAAGLTRRTLRGLSPETAWRRSVRDLGLALSLLGVAAALPLFCPLRAVAPTGTIVLLLVTGPLTAATIEAAAPILRGIGVWLRSLGAALGRLVRLLDPDGWSSRTARVVGVVALVGFTGVLVAVLPQTPFDWDEVQFANAVERFDVGDHRPHPPGYPVYVGLAKAIDAVIGDAVKATQVAAAAGAAIALLFTVLTARDLGSPGSGSSLAGFLLATSPAFAFHANVGMSDALGAGACAAGLWAFARQLQGPVSCGRLVTAAGLAAVAIGVRPQVGIALVAPATWLVIRTAKRGAARYLVVAGGTAFAVVIASWAPAIWSTGLARFLTAIRWTREWVASHEALSRLPGAAPERVLDAWLVRPFGEPALATVFWGLVLLGTLGWLLSDRPRAALIGWLSGGPYLALAPWTMNLDNAPRYLLPALPALALLAAGIVLVPRPSIRRAGLASAVGAGLAMAAWIGPDIARRAHGPAPVWEILELVAARFDPATTDVVLPDLIRPHAERILAPLGFSLVISDNPASRLPRPDRRVVDVRSPAEPDSEGLVAMRRWPSQALVRITRGCYDSASLAVRPVSVPLGEGKEHRP